MRAKVQDEYPWSSVRAFAGQQFVKYEWRRVPAGHEAEAKRLAADGLLELERPKPKPKPKPAPKPEAAKKEEPAPPPVKPAPRRLSRSRKK